jgi:DNA-binding MarR family transcriptional regulator
VGGRRPGDDRDNRLVRLYLTDAGRAVYEPMWDDLRALEQRLTAGMGEPEVRPLMTSLSHVTENAHALADEPGPQVDEDPSVP